MVEPEDTSGAPEHPGAREDISLERYSEIRAYLRHYAGEGETRALRRAGVERPRWDAASAAWTRAIEEDSAGGEGDLVVQFAASFADARRRLEAQEPAPAPSEPPDSPEPSEPSEPPEPRTLSQPPIAPPPVLNRPPSALATTSNVASNRPVTLPFLAAPVSIADRVDPPRIHVAPEPPRPAPPPGMPAVNRAPASLTGTGNIDRSAIAAAVLPFARPAKEPAVAPAIPPGQPPVNTRASAGSIPVLTIEQYASLTAELAVSPERADQIRARYQVAAEDVFQALIRTWQFSFFDQELYARFVGLTAQYRAWLSQKKSG